jgi:hypothetical protein
MLSMDSLASVLQALAAEAVSRQSWTVKRSGDTTEIDLCGAMISSSDQAFSKARCANGGCLST